MHEPQDLPGRFGRVIRAIDHVLQAIDSPAIVAGGWAVWHHGYVQRVTRDVDIVVAANDVEEFCRVAAVSGFDVLPQRPGRWPKLIHRETGIRVDLLPEGARPGTARKLAPTTIPSPAQMGACESRLCYIRIERLFELKLAAGRTQDLADLEQLARGNPQQLRTIRQHLATVHSDYVRAFDELVSRSQQDVEQ